MEETNYEEKRTELEGAEKWRLAHKEQIPYLRAEHLEKSNLYIYQRM